VELLRGKYDRIYDYVIKNLGKEIRFETQVTKQEFDEYLKNYPRKYEANSFMGYTDYYDFTDKKDDEPHWYYKIARHYYDYGYDGYYLPTVKN
jgi:hypothetical protein